MKQLILLYFCLGTLVVPTLMLAEPATVFTAASPLSPEAKTENWVAPVGPHYNGTSGETQLQKTFGPEGPRLLWSLPAGSGYASPVIADDRLVYVHNVGDRLIIVCLQPETGKEIWQYAVPEAYTDQFSRQYGPRCSPVLSKTHVYVYTVSCRLLAINLQDGTLAWQRDLQKDFQIPASFFGAGSTPLLLDQRLIVNVGGASATAAAFDPNTGKTLWQSDGGWGAGYASVVPATLHGKNRVLIFAGGKRRPPTGGLICLDPTTGKVDFKQPWRSTNFASVNAATPISNNNQIFISASYQVGTAMLSVDDTLKPTVTWRSKSLGCQWNTPVLHDGHLYGFDGVTPQLAELVCLNAKTGTEIWREQPEWRESTPEGERTMRILRGCLLHADNAFLCIGEGGHLLWLDLTPKGYKEISRSRLFSADQSFTLPAVSRGLLYVCQNASDEFTNSPPRLLCYDLRKQ